jgi:prephenate dehydrogenase
MKIGIIGLGLIGGSFAKDLKSQINVSVFGADLSAEHCELAMSLGLVDEILAVDNLIVKSDIIIIAVPVDKLEMLIPEVLSKLYDQQILIDVGSTKERICQVVKNHPKRGRFVAAHPLAGTEYSGPAAAIKGLFNGKKNLICDAHLTDSDAMYNAQKVFRSLGMENVLMDSADHDKHLAYVSHLSHVSSFMLGMTVLDIEKDEKQILNLAGTGFASTVRLAKSNPKTWSAIFDKNNKHLSIALQEYIRWLTKFKEIIDAGDIEAAETLMAKANEIKKVLP